MSLTPDDLRALMEIVWSVPDHPAEVPSGDYHLLAKLAELLEEALEETKTGVVGAGR